MMLEAKVAPSAVTAASVPTVAAVVAQRSAAPDNESRLGSELVGRDLLVP